MADKLLIILLFAGIALVLYRFSSGREMRRMMEMTAEEMVRGDTGPGKDHYITLESVTALLIAGCSLLPLVGIPFTAAGIWAVLRARKATPVDPRLRISRWFIRFATAFLVLGAGISLMAVLALVFTTRPYHLAGIFPASVSESPFGTATIIAAIPAVVMSITLHECAHGLVALGMGDDTALKARRLTLNPIRHIDPFGSVILPLALVLLKAGFVFGWARPVPVRSNRLRNPHAGSAAVAVAGAGANFLLVLASLGLYVALGAGLTIVFPQGVEHFTTPMAEATVGGAALHPLVVVVQFFKLMILLNLGLGVLNLIPIPPLDGSRLLEGLWPRTFTPLYGAVRPIGCVLLPGVILTALCVLLAVLLPLYVLIFGVFVPFFVR